MIFKPDIPDANVVKAGSAVYEDRVRRPGFKSFEIQQREMNVLRFFQNVVLSSCNFKNNAIIEFMIWCYSKVQNESSG